MPCAARAGVSFQTAGKVINGRAGVVSAATRERILVAASELGYVPNGLARSLVRQNSLTVGVLMDDLADEALSRFVVAAERTAARERHATLVASAHPSGHAVSSIRGLLEHRVDGILVVAPSLEQDKGLGEALRQNVPAVSLVHVAGGGVPLVGSDHRVTAQLAAEHLLEQGHEQIGMISGPEQRQVVRTRQRAFRGALNEAGARLPQQRAVGADWSRAGGYRAVHALLDADPAVTAAFVHSDAQAVGALKALHDRGVRVPDDFSIVSCDDMPFAAYTVPALTTVHVPFDETGAAAATLLLRRMRGEQVPARNLLAVHLVHRGSTGPPRRARARPRPAPARPSRIDLDERVTP